MTETMYAGKMPILALRGLAVFPDQTVHFDVGRIKSVHALDAAMKQDHDQDRLQRDQGGVPDREPRLRGGG